MIRLLSTVFVAALLAAPAFAGDGCKGCEKAAAAACEKHFTELDADKDGALSKEEFLACKKCDDNAKKAEMFAKFDANKDGKVSKEEFAAGCKGCGDKKECDKPKA